MRSAIDTASGWIGGLADTELGNIGQEFIERFARSGCREKIDIRHTGLADYYSFSLKEGEPFPNNIIYGPTALDDVANLFSSKVHEATHALQKMQSAALHASPFNPDTRIIICPRDWVLLEARCEQDAYVKQVLFTSLLARQLPEVRSMSARDAISVETFENIRAASRSIEDAVVETARQALGKSLYWDNPDAEWRFRDHYQSFALDNYAAGMRVRESRGQQNFIFVRIEPEDVEAIGASCGPNSFGANGILPEFSGKPAMQEATAQKLANLNLKLGIENEDVLPTLGEALQKLGISRKDFIAASYGRTRTPVASPDAPAPGL